MSRTLYLALAVGLLCGCETLPAPRPQTVEVPIPVPCVTTAEIPEAPALRGVLAILRLDDYAAVKALLIEIAESERYSARLKAVLAGCTWDAQAGGGPGAVTR